MALKPGVSRVVATDIDPIAIEAAAGKAREAGVAERVEFRVGDLFEGVEGRFDWVLFNPPYLPSEGLTDEPSWSGGKIGYETTLRFLKQTAGHLKEDGGILLISSSQTGLRLDEAERIYSIEVLEELPLFFERLFCLLLRPLSPSGSPGRSRR
jgi:release factor glutamine methyltransferase